MNLLLAWTPTLIAAFLLAIAAVLVGRSAARDERRKEERLKKPSDN